MAGQRGGGGNENRRRRRKRRGHDENMDPNEMIGDEQIDLLLENFDEARQDAEERIHELEQERDRRVEAMANFSAQLNIMWDDIMQPISCSEDSSSDEENEETETETLPSSELVQKSTLKPEDTDSDFTSSSTESDDEKDEPRSKTKQRKRKKKVQSGKTTKTKNTSPATIILDDASAQATNKEQAQESSAPEPSTSQSKPSKKPGKKYRHSLSQIMFDWAKTQQEFGQEVARLRAEKFKNEQDIEKLAFFKLFSKRNEEYKAKLDADVKSRLAEWKEKKRNFKLSLKTQYKAELRNWVQAEKKTRIREEKIIRKKEYNDLRAYYLSGREDPTFEFDKETSSPAPNEASDNTVDDTKNGS